MNKQEIQMRLAAARPGDRDESDPAIREAVQCCGSDAELRAWFEREQAVDSCICRCLGSVPAPEGLQARILAGARLARPVVWWQRKPWLAAAAIIAAFFAVMIWQQISPPPAQGGSVATLKDYRDDIAALYARMGESGIHLDMQHSDVRQVKAWLSEKGAPADAVLRPGLGEARAFGCKIVKWRGHQVSMMCFGKNNDEAHLFVVSKAAVQGLGGIDPGCIDCVCDYPLVAWQDDRNAYVLVGHTPQSDLKSFL